MSLSEGARLGTYEITGRVGAGGMGEVYRATDSRLGREVAIKTLPAALASDKDRLARFEREARLLASLNHPHIASVYSLDQHEGTLYLAMELVEGATLEEKLKPGALPVEEALQLGLQIAEALEAAHGKGVIHRDLKPANIMVNADGQVKVLDFGLAKAFSNEPEEASPGQSPALSLAMTQQGIILGTAGYMSPEQASGQATDQRADVWAFGVVLYEMLTGLPLFSGESVAHILADVLRMEPDWGRLPDKLHPRLKLMLERCLAKKPRKRYAGIADARVDIEEALNDPEGASLAVAPAGQSQAAPVWPRVAATALVAASLASLAVWLFTPPPEPGLVSRFAILLPDSQFTETENSVVDISRDGTTIVYAADNQLWFRELDELLPRAIQGIDPTQRPTYPVFSPDGQSLLYYSDQDQRLWRIAVVGGTPVAITESLADDPQGLYWHDDGTILYEAGDGNIMTVSVNGGIPEILIAATEGEEFDGPRLLPGGEWILFTVAPVFAEDRWDSGQIVVQSRISGERRVLWQGGSDARYVPTGHLIFALADNLFALRFDLAELTVSGGPTPVVAGVQRGTDRANDSATANYNFADNGSLVYVSRSDEPGGITLVWVDRDGRQEPLGLPGGSRNLDPAVSHDGTRVAMTRVRGSESDVWIWSLQSQTLTRLTFEPGGNRAPFWTPDGERIVYSAGGKGLFSRRADGTGSAEQLLARSGLIAGRGWSAEGQLIVFHNDSGNSDISLVTASGELTPLLATEFNETRQDISPDGRWLAYQSDESGRYEIYVRPFPDVDNGKWQISSGGGREPRWSADGGTLFYMDPTSLMEAAITTSPTFSHRTPQAVFDRGEYYFANNPNRYDVAPDGRFLMMMQEATAAADGAEPQQIVVVQNWFEELQRLVPTQ